MEKRYDHTALEKAARDIWQQHAIYVAQLNLQDLDACVDGPLYSIDTPPPTISGKLHIGHIFSYTQTDIIARYKRMSGFTVFYPFGFDDNGLPTERFVEQKRETTAAKMGRSQFIQACLEETQKVEKHFEELWKQIGLSVDWNNCYSTISETSRKISQASFIDLYHKGYVYRKDEPALYCTAFRTSVAQADLEDVQKTTLFSEVVFTTSLSLEVVIATTRPELLSSCVALFYHPEDDRYKKFKDQHAIVPLYGHLVPFIADEKVSIEKGTGLVMCCTFGDKTDIEWWKKYQLPYRQSIGFDGKMMKSAGPIADLKVQDARSKILDILKQSGYVRKQETLMHSVSVYERSQREIEFLMLPQWFLKILPYKQQLIDLADQINWYPSFMKARYVDWVQNLQWDWCLSRQRFFGIPFPVWHNIKTGAIVVPDYKDLPVDPQEQKFPGAPDDENLVPDCDVMDTWNTSSITPYLCRALVMGEDVNVFESPDQQLNNFIPMAMRPQAHDIIRTWAFYTIIKTWMHQGTIPWKNIVISGHVLSGASEKISKSRGNQPLEPENLLKIYPADAVRYWTASGGLGHDVPFSENTLKIGQKLLVKLWNAALFLFEHVRPFTNQLSCNGDFGILNEWILHRITEVHNNYVRYFDKHEFSLALNSVEQFFWHDFCDNYLELIKNQFFKPELYSAHEINATRYVLDRVFLRILQWYAPYIPHSTEMIYQNLYKERGLVQSIHQTKFSCIKSDYSYPQSVVAINYVLAVVGQIRKLKSDHQLSLKVELAQCTFFADASCIESLRALEKIIKGVTHAQVILYTVQESNSTESGFKEVDGAWYATVVVA